MTRGRKPLGDRAMTDAERQQRRRDQKKTSYQHSIYRLRGNLLNALDRWFDSGFSPEMTNADVYDALHDLVTLLALSDDKSIREYGVLRKRYLHNEPLDEEDRLRRVTRALGPRGP